MNASTKYTPGDVLELFDRQRIIVAMIIGYKKSKIQIVTEKSQQLSIHPHRVIYHSPKYLNPEKPRSENIKELKQISRIRENIKHQIELDNIWRQIPQKNTRINLNTISQYAFEKPDVNELAALHRTIFLDKTYFSLDDSQIYIHSDAHVKKQIQAKHLEEKKHQIKADLISWLDALLKNNQASMPDKGIQFITCMKMYAARRQDFDEKTWTKSILKNAKINTPSQAYHFLVQTGFFDPDENIELIRHDFNREFSHISISEITNQLAERSPSIDLGDRSDLRKLPTFTIDNATTRDMDDAISVDFSDPDNLKVYIHITDVSSCIHPDSFTDQEAKDRVQTLYLPMETIPMLPESISEDLASLIEEKDRYAITTEVTFDRSFHELDYTIFQSIVHIDKNLSYERAEEFIPEDQFQTLSQIARQLRLKRIENGAFLIPRPEINIHIDDDRNITLSVRKKQSSTQFIISELMILTNKLAARKAAECHVPFPFRCQNPPTEEIPKSRNEFDPVIGYRQRRIMSRAYSSVDPCQHFSLGLPEYTNITSPLRRYFDLLAQRQLKNLLKAQTLYEKDDLLELLNEIDTSSIRANQIKSKRESYWILKLIAKKVGQTIRAVVLDRLPRRYQVWLQDYYMDADLPIPIGYHLKPGDEITVVVERVNPLENSLKIRLYE